MTSRSNIRFREHLALRTTIDKSLSFLATMTVSCLLCVSSLADDIQASALRDAGSVGGGYDSDRKGIEGTFFFRDLFTYGPRNLDPYKQSAAFVTFGMLKEERLPSSSVVASNALKRDTYFVAGDTGWALSRWYIHGSAQVTTTVPLVTALASASDETEYDLILGRRLKDYQNTSAAVAIRSATSDRQSQPVGCVAPLCNSDHSFRSSEIGVLVSHIGSFESGIWYYLTGGVFEGGSDRAMRLDQLPLSTSVTSPNPPRLLELNSVESDRFKSYFVSFEIFPTLRFSTRLGYMRWDGDPLRDDSREVEATWFFWRNVSFHLGYSKLQGKRLAAAVDDFSGYRLRFTGRF